MNYCKIYNDIIINRKNNKFKGYTEKHHILPRCLQGSNKKDNIVRLTAREHFICHLLLTKMYKEGSVEWIKMTKAFMNMYRQSKENQQRYCPSKWYEYCRIKLCGANSLNQIGENNSCYGTCWIINLQTRDIKRIKKEEFHDYEKQGYIKGRSFDERYRLCNGRYKKLTAEQKERNTKI